MNDEIKEKALEYLKEDKIIDFFKLFFNVHRKDDSLYMDTWTKNGSLIYIPLSIDKWKEDFERYIKNFSDNLNESIGDTDKLTRVQVDSVNFLKWISEIFNLITLNDTYEAGDLPKKETDIYVVTLDKGHYKKKDLEEMSDKEKFETALKDNKRCQVYTRYEYEDLINAFKPLEKYVWTYIVRVPCEQQAEKDIVVLD